MEVFGGVLRRGFEGRSALSGEGRDAMGEIADAMLDGTFCQGCGQYIEDGGACGHPRFCASCRDEIIEWARDYDGVNRG